MSSMWSLTVAIRRSSEYNDYPVTSGWVAARRFPLQRTTNGFSVVELMVVLCVAATLVVFALPNYRVLVDNNQSSTTINSYISGFQLARAEAVARQQAIEICASNSTQTGCATSTSWTDGWIVRTTGGTILQTRQGANDNSTMTEVASTGALPTGRVSFDSNGFASPRQTLRLCREGSAARAVVINPVGFVYAAADSAADADTIVEDHTGTNVVCP